MRRVVITGIGALTAGGDWYAFETGGWAGPASFTPWPEDLAPPFPGARIARVASVKAGEFLPAREQRYADRFAVMSVNAAGHALAAAGLWPLPEGMSGDAIGTITGTSRPEYGGFQRFSQPVMARQPGKLNPALFPYLARNVGCGQICLTFGLRGPSSNLSAGPLSGLQAISRAGDLVRTGRADVMLAGGIECISRISLMQSKKLFDGHLKDSGSFFGEAPAGLVPAEASVFMVVEAADHARARGARPLAQFAGQRFGRLDRSAPDGKFSSLVTAFADAATKEGHSGEVIASSCASGGNMWHDRVESDALVHLAKTAGYRLRTVACRALAGEAEAGASALQAAVAVHALSRNSIPATEGADPAAARTLGVEASRSACNAKQAIVTGVDAKGGYAMLAFSTPG